MLLLQYKKGEYTLVMGVVALHVHLTGFSWLTNITNHNTLYICGLIEHTEILVSLLFHVIMFLYAMLPVYC